MNKKDTDTNRNKSLAISYPPRKRWQSLVHGVPFSKIKETVLGKKYALSIVFVAPKAIRELNRQYRKKDSATDILSFPLSNKEGELYLCMQLVKKKAPEFGMNARAYLSFLLVHGMLHLQGHDHGKKMEARERKFCKTLKIPNPYGETA